MLPRSGSALAWVAFCAALGGCTLPDRPAALPSRDVAFVAVLSGEMRPPISMTGRHAWLVAGLPGEPLRRYEYVQGGERGPTAAPFAYFGDGDVALHGVARMNEATAREVVRCLDRETDAYAAENPAYLPIPGPNSNTFVDRLLRRCGIHIELPATAVGRDYRGIVGASVTESGTGVQVESWVLGARVGLRDGVEAHLFGLALGVHAWPPALTLPINPGRIGFDDTSYASELQKGRAPDMACPAHAEGRGRGGTVNARLFGAIARVGKPELAGGLADRVTTGVSARGLVDLLDLRGRDGSGPTLGWGAGLDLELGAGLPLTFVYNAYIYPFGIGLRLGRAGYVGTFHGLGTSGATGHVDGRLELPNELRLEFEADGRTRVGARAAVIVLGTGGTETVVSTFARIGRPRRPCAKGALTDGAFFALERRGLTGTFWLGLALGIEIDAVR